MADLIDARRAVESGLAYLAARRATPEQIRQLERLHKGLKEAIDTGDSGSVVEYDLPCHHLIAEISKSNILQFLSKSLFETLGKFIHIVSRTPKGCLHHAEVCAAIAGQKGESTLKNTLCY